MINITEEKKFFEDFIEDYNTATMPKEMYYDIKLYEQYMERKQGYTQQKKIQDELFIQNDENQKNIERKLKSELYDYQLTKAALNQIIEDKEMIEGIKENQNKAAIIKQTYKMGDIQKALEMQKELQPKKQPSSFGLTYENAMEIGQRAYQLYQQQNYPLAKVTFIQALETGLQEVKTVLQECIIYPSLRPDIFCGIRAPPRGILLYGPPGNGKTLIAKAVATECNAVFFNLSASNLVSKYMGEGEKMIKALFQCAFTHQPSIIFIDEVDSILKQRTENEHEASRRLKTEFLIQLDGANTSDQDRVTIIAATNCPEQIDSAAFRRFTKRILIDVPDLEARIQLVQLNLNSTTHSLTNKQIQDFAKQLQGYSCSDIKALVKEACMEPLRKFNQDNLLNVQVEEIDKVCLKDLQKAMQTVPPSLQKKELEYFQQLKKKYNQSVF